MSKGKILVVDDDAFVTDVFQRYLGLEGFEVIRARNGREALEKLKGERFVVIFLDIVMPGMDGVETLRAIKKVRQQTPVVMMTGFEVEEKVKEAKKLRAYECLRKPFGIGEVAMAMEKALR